MSKYHIHPVTGEPKSCSAFLRCPFSGEHYDSPEEARSGFEKTMAPIAIQTLKKTKDGEIFANKQLVLDVVSKVKETATDPDAHHAIELFQKNLSRIETMEEIRRLKWVNQEMLENVPMGKNQIREALIFNFNTLDAITTLNDEEERKAQDIDYFQSRLDTQKEKMKNLEQKLSEETFPPRQEIQMKEIQKRKSIIDDLEERLQKTNNSENPGQLNFLEELKELEETELGQYPFLGVKPGDKIGNEAHLMNVVSENADYIGQLSSKDHSEKMQVFSEVGNEFLTNFVDKNGDFYQPSPGKHNEVSEDFKFIGSGVESNAYLHEPSGMVYKIFHCTSWKTQDPDPDIPLNVKMESSIQIIEKKYAGVDRKILTDNNSEYIETFFIRSNDKKGNPIPLIVQPYLDPEAYVPFDPSYTDLEIAGPRANLTDLHAGNIKINVETLKVVFFDCIL